MQVKIDPGERTQQIPSRHLLIYRNQFGLPLNPSERKKKRPEVKGNLG